MLLWVFLFLVITGLAAWIMQERTILSTDSVMNSLNMGIVSKPLLLSLCFFSLLAFNRNLQFLNMVPTIDS